MVKVRKDWPLQKRPTYSCIMPMHHMAIKPDGRIMPCCIFRQECVPEDLTIEHKDPFNHPFMKNNRELVTLDKPIDGCARCYHDEKVTGKSMRTEVFGFAHSFMRMPKDKSILGKKAVLTNMDITFSNVCNQKCRMCGPELSTQWYSDAKKMNYPFKHRGIISNNWLKTTDFSNITFMKILGGEPLMEQDKIKELLEKCNRPNLTIHITTNASLKPDKELLDLLLECTDVFYTLSIDQYGEFNNFLRKNSDWEITKDTLKWSFETFGKGNTTIHSAISVYNVNKAYELIEFAIDKMMYQKTVIVDGPNWMMPRNLPKSIKKHLQDMCKEKQKTIKEKMPHISVINNCTELFDNLLDELDQEGDFGMFLRNDTKLNILRNEHWKDYNPWLWEMIQPYIEHTDLEPGQLNYLKSLR